MRRLILPASLLLSAAGVAAQPGPLPDASPAATSVASPAATSAHLDDAAKERFLMEGEIVRRRGAPGGVTGSTRATLRLDGIEHDAHIQDIELHKPYLSLRSGMEVDFRDSYRNNVAAYRLDRLLGLGMVPVTVVRRDRDGPASFTWWVDEVLMDEKARRKKKLSAPDARAWNEQMYAVRIFDQLIHNFDRNLGNLLIDRDWRIWMIDHTRAFKMTGEMRTPENLGIRCARDLLARLRRLDEPTLAEVMEGLLERGQIRGLLARRDLIVGHFEARIARFGEPAVLYDLPSRVIAGSPQ